MPEVVAAPSLSVADRDNCRVVQSDHVLHAQADVRTEHQNPEEDENQSEGHQFGSRPKTSKVGSRSIGPYGRERMGT